MIKPIHWIVFVLLTLVSCDKEKFPDKEILIGTWTEQTDISFKQKLVFDAETLLFFKSTTVDTLLYSLNKKTGLLFLSLKNNPSSGSSSHEISYNKKSKTLTIHGLIATINDKSETKFLKE